MIELNVDLFGLDDVTRRILFVKKEWDDKIPGAINRTCQTGAEMAAGMAPVDKGTLRSDIGFREAVQTGDGWEGRVGVGVAYGRRRMDLGFSGTDSRGRSYNDPANPVFGPVAAQLPGILARELRG